MTDSSTLSTLSAVGHYCGRFGPGLFGEPQNAFTNLAFLVGALYGWRTWRANGSRGRWPPVLIALAAGIGFGSFVFHSVPTPATLIADFVPIQVFGLAFLACIALEYLHFRRATTLLLLLAFLLAWHAWIAVTPPEALGGGITYIPSLLALAIATFFVRRTGAPLWRHMATATGAYAAALLVRAPDLAICARFPWGLHWAWHLLSALTVSLLVHGVAALPPSSKESVQRSG